MLPGTHCLDGSPGAYYLRPPLSPSPPASSPFVIFHEGGGWCYGDANCYSRSLSDLGSSKNYPDLPPNRLPSGVSYEGAALFTSPAFATATIAYAKYCTGDSLTGMNFTVTMWNNTRLYYQGRLMLDALFASLMPRGLSTAAAVLYAGCSAGALTAYSHIDYLASLLPSTTMVVGLADAMYALHVPSFPGGEPFFAGMVEWGFTAFNSSASVNQDCLAHYGMARGAECMFGGQVAPFIKAPMLIVNSKHDTWQEVTILELNTTHCPGTIAKNGTITLCLPSYPKEEAFWVAYGETTAASVQQLPPRHGAFLTCVPFFYVIP